MFFTNGIRESFNLTKIVSDGEEEQDEEILESLEGFLNQTWNIWAVSLLYNFEFDDEVKLKFYSKRLREEVACMVSKENVVYDAKISVLEMKRPLETDGSTVKLEVNAKIATNENQQTCVYKGYLLSWKSELLDSNTSNNIRLPLLLCKGTQNTIKAVHSTLTKMFDCIFLSLPANADDLSWLLPIILTPKINNDKVKATEEVSFEYTIPGLPSSENIKMKFNLSCLIKLWGSILGQRNKIEAKDVKKFYSVIYSKMLDVGGLQLDYCLLHKLSLPAITISGSRVKVKNLEIMDIVLTYLNEKALDALHLSTSTLS